MCPHLLGPRTPGQVLKLTINDNMWGLVVLYCVVLSNETEHSSPLGSLHNGLIIYALHPVSNLHGHIFSFLMLAAVCRQFVGISCVHLNTVKYRASAPPRCRDSSENFGEGVSYSELPRNSISRHKNVTPPPSKIK